METTQLHDRITALEQTLERLTTQQEKIVSIIATVDTSREAELLQRLEAAEEKIAALTAASSSNTTRKTIPTGVTTMLAKFVGASRHENGRDAGLVAVMSPGLKPFY